MPDLTLTEDQAMLQELAKEFAAETVTPNAATWEEGAIFPMDAIREAHDLGLLTLKIPERYGGGGMGTMEEVLVHEELGRGDAGFAELPRRPGRALDRAPDADGAHRGAYGRAVLGPRRD